MLLLTWSHFDEPKLELFIDCLWASGWGFLLTSKPPYLKVASSSSTQIKGKFKAKSIHDTFYPFSPFAHLVFWNIILLLLYVAHVVFLLIVLASVAGRMPRVPAWIVNSPETRFKLLVSSSEFVCLFVCLFLRFGVLFILLKHTLICPYWYNFQQLSHWWK